MAPKNRNPVALRNGTNSYVLQVCKNPMDPSCEEVAIWQVAEKWFEEQAERSRKLGGVRGWFEPWKKKLVGYGL